jgi:hypothetical protein
MAPGRVARVVVIAVLVLLVFAVAGASPFARRLPVNQRHHVLAVAWTGYFAGGQGVV